MNDLETHALRLIGENTDSPDVFTDDDAGIAQIRQSISDAVQEICMVTGCYKRTYLLPMTADKQFYRMGWESDHFGWVVEAWDRSRSRRLSQTNASTLFQDDLEWLSTGGDPDQYFPIGHDMIGLFPTPDADGSVLEITCVCIPKKYTSEKDPIRVQKSFRNAAVYLGVSEYYASTGNAGRATEYMMRYMDTLGLAHLNPISEEKRPVLGGGR